MSTITTLVRLACVLIVITSCRAAPQSLTCMSYLEDDRAAHVQDDFDSDEYPSSAAQFNADDSEHFLIVGSLSEPDNSVPHRRICPSDYTFCFSLWRTSENGSRIEKQGCWKESTDRNASCSQTECTSSLSPSRNNSLHYCCCSGNMCNQHVAVVEPAPLQFSKDVPSIASNLTNRTKQMDSMWGLVLLWCAFFAACFLISVLATYFYCRNVKDKPIPEEAPLAPSGPGYSSNLHNVDNINLLCMLGSGKYGTVMKGLLHDQEVAVKIFPETHKQYFINERNIYTLPLMESPSLLTYFGYDERHTMEGKVEYQLVLSLAPLGCLQDWLIANAMDFEIFCGMVKSITRGLSHLHTELRRGNEVKPCIAHRDLNSRNVLVKADRTCCIADFGFALKVLGSKYEYKGVVAMAETKSINEVGTLRYMAPELLEGAVNLRDCETSLKQMDVYALGLVLWEVSTRCTSFYSQGITPPYKAPYELEVGAHPTFDQMQALVVRHKARPLFPAGWGGGPVAKLVKDTCEDCWDHDAEARLTSVCAEERMQEVAGLRPRLHAHAQSTSHLLSANNLVGEQANSTPQNAQIFVGEQQTTILNPPPNRKIQILSRVHSCENEGGNNFGITPVFQTEKNHLMCPQQPLQPYQGRNPCQERNLAPVTKRPPQVLVEKSKKHSFQTSQENSLSCLEDDVSVEELISGSYSKKMSSLPQDASNMGQGFPKQHNTDKKLRGWYGVRALIQKKLFRRDDTADVFQELRYGDEKSNLVDNRYAGVLKGFENNSPLKTATISFIDDKPSNTNGVATKKTTLDGVYTYNRRPNNLDLAANGGQPPTDCNKSNLIQNVTEECKGMTKAPMPSLETRISTPSHVVPRSLSTSLIKHKNIDGEDARHTTATTSDANRTAENAAAFNEYQFRRQRSLEVFREVFKGHASAEKLRNPSQRVKTPGDVPPSVRKVRASKTLSLYDDRMMDSSMLNIL